MTDSHLFFLAGAATVLSLPTHIIFENRLLINLASPYSWASGGAHPLASVTLEHQEY
jgi:hypothetical protein